MPVVQYRTGKKTPGGAGTRTRTHKGTRTTQTNLTTIQTHQQHTPRTSARRPKPRPTQQPQEVPVEFCRARHPDSSLVHSDGDRRPSRGTDGSRYPRFVPSSSRPGLWQHRLRGVQGGRHLPCPGCVVVSPASVALARRPLHARRAVLHDLDPALPGRLRRGCCACPPPPLASRAYRGLRPHCRPLRVCRTRLHFADRFRAGAGGALGAGGGRVGFAGGGLF